MCIRPCFCFINSLTRPLDPLRLDAKMPSSFRNNIFSLSLVMLVSQLLVEVYSSSPQDTIATVVIVGDNMTFPGCNYSAVTLLTILRFSKSKAMSPTTRIAYKRDKETKVDQPYRNRVSIVSSGYLVLWNISVEDQGFYECVINHESGDEERYALNLVVGIPPVIRSFPCSRMKIFEGQNLRMVCNATGVPVPSIVWYKNTTLLTGSKDGELEIHRAKLSDSEVYYCKAENEVGKAEKSLKIQVYPKPTVSEFYHTGSMDKIYECQDVNLRCEASGNGPPVTMFHFYRNERMVECGSKTGVYQIIKIRAEDQGTYTCVPENKVGRGLNKSLKIEVQESSIYCDDDVKTSEMSATTESSIYCEDDVRTSEMLVTTESSIYCKDDEEAPIDVKTLEMLATTKSSIYSETDEEASFDVKTSAILATTGSLPPSARLVGTTPSGYPRKRSNCLVTIVLVLVCFIFDRYPIQILVA